MLQLITVKCRHSVGVICCGNKVENCSTHLRVPGGDVIPHDSKCRRRLHFPWLLHHYLNAQPLSNPVSCKIVETQSLKLGASFKLGYRRVDVRETSVLWNITSLGFLFMCRR